MKVGQQYMDARNLAPYKLLPQGANAAAAVDDDRLFFAGAADFQAGRVAAVAQPVWLRRRNGTAVFRPESGPRKISSPLFLFHGGMMNRHSPVEN